MGETALRERILGSKLEGEREKKAAARNRKRPGEKQSHTNRWNRGKGARYRPVAAK